jgi:hypothetical protein
MLIAEDGDGTLVGKCGADAVGADAGLCPDRAGPEAEFAEFLVVAGSAPALQGDAVLVGQKQAAAGPANGGKETIELFRRAGDQLFGLLARAAEFLVGEAQWSPLVLGGELMHGHAPPP